MIKLAWGSAPHPGSVARGGPCAPLRFLAGAPCAPKPVVRPGQPVQNLRSRRYNGLSIVLALICVAPVAAQTGGSGRTQGASVNQGVRQTEQDEYTKYELLAPDTASFAIDYEVTATTPGAIVAPGSKV